MRTSKILFAISVILVGQVAATSVCRADRLIGADDGELIQINSTTGAISNVVTTSEVPCSVRVVSIAEHPDTGVLYAIDRGNPSQLVTINPANGDVTAIGETGSEGNIGWISTITFGPAPNYPLYAIVGGDSDGGTVGGIYTLDLTTGAPTATGWTPAGTGGHAIEFNPDDGMIYNFHNSSSSGSGTTSLDKIDPADGTRASVTLSGDTIGAINGIAYAGAGLFYAYDNTGGGAIFSVTTAGAISELSNPGDNVRALAYVSGNLLAVEGASSIYQYDPGTGAISNEVLLERFDSCDAKLYSIAKDPTTGRFFVISDYDRASSDNADLLSEIDVVTGLLSNSVHIVFNSDPTGSENLSGITFDSSGQLYGVVGSRGSTLGGGTIVRINRATGEMTTTGWGTTQNVEGGHSLEFNPDDGKLYHFFTNFGNATSMEKIDPGMGTVESSIQLSNQPTNKSAGVVYAGGGSFLLRDISDTLSSVSTTGVATNLANINSPSVRGLELAPDLPVPSTVDNSAARAAILKKLKKLKKKLKKAKGGGKSAKLKKLKKQEKKLKKALKALS